MDLYNLYLKKISQLLSMDKTKPRKIKEKTVPVGFRIGKSIADRVDKLGTRGTEIAKIASRFVIVNELVTKIGNDKLIQLDDNHVLYVTSLHPADIYHLTVKNGNEIKTIELSSEKAANLILNLVELLNIDHQPQL